MTTDRIRPTSGLPSSAKMPQRSVVQPKGASPTSVDSTTTLGATVGTTQGTSDSFQDKSLTQTWEKKVASSGSREAAAQILNTAVSSARNFAPSTSNTSVSGYSRWLHLGSKSLKPTELTASKYKETVQENLKDFKSGLTSERLQKLTQTDTWKNYGRETLSQNVKPVKELLSDNSDKNWGAGLSRLFGLGLLGLDVAKNTKETYDNAKAQGDGSATQKTAMAAAKYTLRAGLLWELAGVGVAVGRAVLPIAVESIPLGGILAGALFSAVGQKFLDPILHTGSSDPDHAPKLKTQA